jgi:hypothetical protein
LRRESECRKRHSPKRAQRKTKEIRLFTAEDAKNAERKTRDKSKEEFHHRGHREHRERQ